MANDSDKKKDLTGILDLQKLQAEDPNATFQNESQDPFAMNELQPIEQINDFASIDQIGMMDHPEPTTEPTPEPTIEPLNEQIADQSQDFAIDQTSEQTTEQPVAEDPFAVNVSDAQPAHDPFAMSNFETPPSEATRPAEDPFAMNAEPAAPTEEPMVSFEAPVPLPKLKSYSEQTQGKTNLEVKVHYPFHLKINGNFGPFERDKLLLFISENPIGLSSSELDLQIQAGKVFLPRISEYAAVKLVQDLRDSGLQFVLHPSDRDVQETTVSEGARIHYQNEEKSEKKSSLSEIPILNANAVPQKPFTEIDEVSVIQFVRTEILEVESSPVIQEVIERMTESLKQKARLKGGNALLSLQKEITPLRLPSQYQISLKASVIKIDPV